MAENDPSLPLGATAPVPDVLQDGGLAGPKAASYRNEVWETAAVALYQQELSASYLRVWRWIERGSLFLVTATASGSSIIVWGEYDLKYGLADMEAHKRVYALRKVAQACPTRPRGGILDMAWYHNRATLRAAKIMKGWQRDGT